MVNIAYPGEELPERRRARERRREREKASADASRSEPEEAREEAISAASERARVAKAGRKAAKEIYAHGLHHLEVAEKHGVSVEAVKWLMKERGIGFHGRDMGEPSREVSQNLDQLTE